MSGFSSKKTLFRALAVFLVLMSNQVYAQSCSTKGIVKNQTFSISEQSLSSPANNFAIGQAIGVRADNNGAFFETTATDNTPKICKFYRSTAKRPAGVAVVPNIKYNDGATLYDVFSTSVPGIGYVIGVADGRSNVYGAVPGSGELITYDRPAGTGDPRTFGFKTHITFVATGALRTGTYSLNNLLVAELYAYQNDGVLIGPAKVFVNATLKITALTCNVTTGSSVVLKLPNVRDSHVAQWGVGETGPYVGKSNIGTVSFLCPAGVELFATIVDANNAANTSELLTIEQGESDARGVSFRLKRQVNNTGAWVNVAYGPNSDAKGTLNQWKIVGSTSANTSASVNLQAEYIRSGIEVRPGPAKGRATMVLSFQ